MLWPFFADLGKTPDRVKPADVLAWVHGIGKSGRTPSPTTIGARIAFLSSYFRFLIRMGLVGLSKTYAGPRRPGRSSKNSGSTPKRIRTADLNLERVVS